MEPAENLDDLEPLRRLVGDARVVSLGEATHGTREFFQMKHRILRFLVERMGFTAFAIEATWPEANRLDRYLRTGEGDPAVLVLWAHNGHVATRTGVMGGALREMLGPAMVTFGFSFAQGTFNAVGVSPYTPLGPHTVGAPKYDSYEEYFAAAAVPRFFLDLRNRSALPDTPSWLPGPRSARSIGSMYADASPDDYYYQARLPTEFDVVIFLDRTTAAVPLPFNYPTTF